jgi:hypothetical protein
MSPEETIQKLMQSEGGFLPKMQKFARQLEAAQGAAPSYQALGESRPAPEIVADLLRGGPTTGEFHDRALLPIARRREKMGLGPGQPLPLENVIGALHKSGFYQPSRPTIARKALIEKIAEMISKRLGKGGQ